MGSALRNWVLIPITLVMVLVGVLRNNLMQFLESPPKPAKLAALRQRNILSRASALRANYLMIPPSAVALRRTFLTRALSDGSYLAPDSKAAIERERKRKPDEMPEVKNPLSDPNTMDMMLEQAKKSLVMMVPQTAIMGWINFFFSGFVLSRTPTDPAADSSRDMAMGAGGAALMMQEQVPGQVDHVKLHAAEKDSLELMGASQKNDSVAWVGDRIEDRVLALYA